MPTCRKNIAKIREIQSKIENTQEIALFFENIDIKSILINLKRFRTFDGFLERLYNSNCNKDIYRFFPDKILFEVIRCLHD